MVELKPCPFCGQSSAGITYVRDGWKATCGCGASAKSCFHGPLDMPSSEERAVAAWNTRTDNARIQALEAENARLREALKPLVDATDEYLTTGSDRSGIAAMINAMREAVRAARQSLSRQAHNDTQRPAGVLPGGAQAKGL